MRTRSRSGSAGVGQDPAELVLDVLVLGVVALVVQLLEGSLVPLVHEEELALGQHLVDDLVEEVTPLLEGDGLVPPCSRVAPCRTRAGACGAP